MRTAVADRRRTAPHRGPLLLPLIVLTAAAAAAIAYVGYVLWPRWPGPAVSLDTPALPIAIGGVTFHIPPAAIRVPLQRRPGSQERLDLVFAWPSLEPPDPAAKPGAGAALANNALDRIFVTITAAAAALDPAERVLTIYPRYTAAETQAGPGELTLLPFRDGTPYQGEDLLYDSAAPGFLVRCTRDGPGPTPGMCLYERRIADADLVLRLPRAWLADWRSVNDGIEQLVGGLRPTPRQ